MRGIGALGFLMLLAFQERKEDPALDRFYAANALYNRGLFDLAAEEYDAFLKSHPKHPRASQARYGRALCDAGRGRHDRAEKVLRRLAEDEEFVDRAGAHAQWGYSLLALGRTAEAEKAFVWAAGRGDDATRLDALAGLCEVRYAGRRWKELLSATQQFLERGDMDARGDRIRYQAAAALYGLGRFEDAVERLDAWMDRHEASPLAPHARFLRAESRLQAGDERGAGREFGQLAGEKEGAFAGEARFRLGALRLSQGRHDEAIRELERFRRDHGGSDAATILLGRARLEKGDERRAEEVLAPLGDNPEAALWLARARARQGRLEAAEKGLRGRIAAVGDAPIRVDLEFELGAVLLEGGSFEAAAKRFARAVEASPDGPLASEGRRLAAHAFHRAGAHARSVEWCNRFLDRHSSHERAPDVSFLRAESLFLGGRPEEAGAAYETFLRDHGSHERAALATFRTGEILYGRSDWKGALKAIAPLLEKRQDDPAMESLWFIAGDCRLRLGKGLESAEAFRRFLKRHPRSAHADLAGLLLARAHETAGDRRKAVEALRKMLADHGKSAHAGAAWLDLGRLHHEEDRPGDARKALAEAARRGKAPEAAFALGWVELAEGREAEATKRFGEVPPGHELFPRAVLQVAALNLRSRDLPGARSAAKRGLAEAEPGETADRLRHLLGRVSSREGKWEEALSHFDRIPPDSPVHADVLLDGARAQRAAGRLADAIGRLEAFLGSHAEHERAGEAILVLSAVEVEAGRSAAAEERLRKVLPELRGEPLFEAQLLLATALEARGDTEEAVRWVETVARTGKGKIAGRAWFRAGTLRLARKEFEEALDRFRHAPGEAAVIRKAECEALLGRWKESEKTCREFLERAPESPLAPRARFGRGWALENLGRHEAALEAYREVTARAGRDETTARCRFQAGECLFALKRYGEAIKELIHVEANSAFPRWRSRALLEIGRILEAQDRRGEAAERYREVLRKYGDHEAAAVARQLLDKLNSDGGNP